MDRSPREGICGASVSQVSPRDPNPDVPTEEEAKFPFDLGLHQQLITVFSLIAN